MPMPEIGEYELSELQDRGDGLQDFDLNMSEVLRLMNDCYAAGKADALPQWPPEGEFSKGGKGRYKFMNGEWWAFMTTMWGAFQNCRGSNEMTAAYFRGELEEVK